MSASDDDLGGDEDQLKQLRSVWVSMREADEDPPDRGLDALMAAARTKAAAMAPPPREGFWTKVLAVLRRPPMLALASVTVLLGGALFVTQRRDRMQAEETVRAEDRPPPSMGSAAPGGDAPAPALAAPTRTTPPEAHTSHLAPPPAEKVSPAEPTPAPPTAQIATGSPLPRPRPSGKREETPKQPAAVSSEAGELQNDDAVVDEVGLGGAGRDEVDRGGTRGAVAQPPVLAPEPGGRAAMNVTESISVQKKATMAGPALGQLVKQCESAAARNDCAAVKLLARRIQETDAAAFKQQLANNAAIARCLAE